MENTWKLRVEGGPLSIYIYIWVWVNTYRYILSGLFTSINPSYDLGFTRYQGFDPSPYVNRPGQERVPLGRHLPGALGPAATQQAADVVDLAGISLHPLGPGAQTCGKHVGSHGL